MDLMSTLNTMNLYRYYRFSRYLYTLSSFIGFLFILLNSPQRLAILLKFAGLSHTTIFSQSFFKDVCHAIENAAIASDRRRHNSIIVPYTGKMGQHKDGRHGEGKQDEGKEDKGKQAEGKQDGGKEDKGKQAEGKQDEGKEDKGKEDEGKEDEGKEDKGKEAEGKQEEGKHINGKLQYAMNDDTLIRWYCKCHDLRPLSLRICPWGGFLCLTYCRAKPSKARYADTEPASWQLLGSYKTRTSFIEDLKWSSQTFDVVKSYLAHGPRRREFVPWMDPIEDVGRLLETVVLKDTLKDSIIERIQSFIDKKQRYLDRGHRHQYGMLWDGPPGCGKTSLIDAIAKRFGFSIYTFALGDVTLNDSAIMALYLSMGPMAIAVFEDIDRVQLGEKGITEAVLLMLLDGFGTKDKTLLKIMTCNNKENVSPAVQRRGRIDEDYYFPLASRTQAEEMFLRNNIWEADVTKALDLCALAKKFAQAVPDNAISPADIAVYIKNAETPQEAIDQVHKLTAKKEEEMKSTISGWTTLVARCSKFRILEYPTGNLTSS